MNRCKHLCCREGLEKPHKAARKQSANGNQPKNGLNQLTLSASIPRTKAGRTSMTETRDKRTGKTHTKDVESTAIDSDITDIGDIFNLNSTAHVSKPQCSSSDYGDDSFDDLPSPSKLLAGCSTGPTTQVNGNIEIFASKCDDISAADDTWTDVDDLFTYRAQPSSTDSPEQVRIHTATLVKGKRDQTQTSVPPENSAFGRVSVSDENDNPRASEAEADKALDPSHVSDEHRGRKRNLSRQSEGAHDERTEKRAKHGEPCQISGGQIETIIETNSSVQGSANPPEVPKDWDDIDPALLHEFKDIVNFF